MRSPAVAGQRLEEVDTPALVLELDAFEANLRTLADNAGYNGAQAATIIAIAGSS